MQGLNPPPPPPQWLVVHCQTRARKMSEEGSSLRCVLARLLGSKPARPPLSREQRLHASFTIPLRHLFSLAASFLSGWALTLPLEPQRKLHLPASPGALPQRLPSRGRAGRAPVDTPRPCPLETQRTTFPSKHRVHPDFFFPSPLFLLSLFFLSRSFSLRGKREPVSCQLSSSREQEG